MLSLNGLRGFASEQKLTFAEPNGNEGSGLTVLVGPNNGGKSTVLEALRAVTQKEMPSFSERKRNAVAGSRVRLSLQTDEGSKIIQTIASGGSECERLGDDKGRIMFLPSRRILASEFSKQNWTREDYMENDPMPPNRAPGGNKLPTRLFHALDHRDEFNKVLAQVLTKCPDWTIERDDRGHYFLKITESGHAHSSEGLGEGLLSLFFLVDALYDSQPKQAIVIDEPELSLHPALQKRLLSLFIEYSARVQIIYSTHSAYFIDFAPIASGATVARVFKDEHGCQIRQLTNDTSKKLQGFLSDTHNPHVLGLHAREAFFVEDNVILVEGQDDVIHLRRIQEQLGISFKGEFFGFGVGGATKMGIICTVLEELGYRGVVGILDGDAEGKTAQEKLSKEFPHFLFVCIPAEDIKTKKAKALHATVGLLDDDNKLLRPEHNTEVAKMFATVNEFFEKPAV